MAKQTLKSKPKRFDVYWVELDPTVGHEMKKTRPCMLVSPDDLNKSLGTVIVAPITSTSKHYGYRVPMMLKNIQGSVALDQIRVVDKSRLKKLMGTANHKVAVRVLEVLTEMFAW